jgi:hypothetical protein
MGDDESPIFVIPIVMAQRVVPVVLPIPLPLELEMQLHDSCAHP